MLNQQCKWNQQNLQKEKFIGNRDDETLQLMNKRTHEGKCNQSTKAATTKSIKNQCSKGKLQRLCEEIRQLQTKYDTYNMRKYSVLYDAYGKINLEVEKKLKLWKSRNTLKMKVNKINFKNIPGDESLYIKRMSYRF